MNANKMAPVKAVNPVGRLKVRRIKGTRTTNTDKPKHHRGDACQDLDQRFKSLLICRGAISEMNMAVPTPKGSAIRKPKCDQQ